MYPYSVYTHTTYIRPSSNFTTLVKQWFEVHSLMCLPALREFLWDFFFRHESQLHIRNDYTNLIRHR